jgi:hypothetical protein
MIVSVSGSKAPGRQNDTVPPQGILAGNGRAREVVNFWPFRSFANTD